MHLLTSSRTISAALLLSLAACCNAQQSQYAIKHLAGDVYMYSGGGTGTFMVTPDGVVVADAPNPGVAQWLQAEIQDRFRLPITHLLYSHFHWDHASGGEVFEGAIDIAHENFVKNLAGPSKYAPLTSSRDYYDGRFQYHDSQGNGDGRLQNDEVNSRYKALLGDSDLNGDGVLSYYEIHQGQHPGVAAGIDAGLSMEQMQATLLLEDCSAWGAYSNWRTANIQGMYDYLMRSKH